MLPGSQPALQKNEEVTATLQTTNGAAEERAGKLGKGEEKKQAGPVL